MPARSPEPALLPQQRGLLHLQQALPHWRLAQRCRWPRGEHARSASCPPPWHAWQPEPRLQAPPAWPCFLHLASPFILALSENMPHCSSLWLQPFCCTTASTASWFGCSEHRNRDMWQVDALKQAGFCAGVGQQPCWLPRHPADRREHMHLRGAGLRTKQAVAQLLGGRLVGLWCSRRRGRQGLLG